MERFDIYAKIDDLRQKGEPFCVATVIRTADATSAKAGAKAAVTADGTILGHLGGGCVQRAVRTAAERAMEQGGTPQIIRVKPSDTVVAMQDSDGAHLYKSGCPSGGTVDLLIEPWQPAPRLVVFGTSPIAQMLAAHAALAGFRLTVQSGLETGVDASRVDLANLSDLTLAPRDFVVVASQGQADLTALRAALSSPARRVSMVASHKKAAALTDKLRAEGMGDGSVARLKSPAGLDIGGVDPQDIAISVLAELVLWRNQDASGEDSSEFSQSA